MLDVLQGNVDNPIGNATQFRGRINGYDLWVESSKCSYAKEVGGNVFFTDEDFHYVHNMQAEKTDDAIIIYDHVTCEWKRGMIIGDE